MDSTEPQRPLSCCGLPPTSSRARGTESRLPGLQAGGREGPGLLHAGSSASGFQAGGSDFAKAFRVRGDLSWAVQGGLCLVASLPA